ncbi:MAG TPA: flagellar protein FlaG [Burkholderiaceae bacterium]|nr:flagellar protein FlaG [Burkholderiaceae bacterium]
MDIRANLNIESGPKIMDKSQLRPEAPAATRPVADTLQPLTAVHQAAATTNAGVLDEAVKNINNTIRALSQNLEFSIDGDSNRTVVKVVDQQTKEIIRQMPSAEALEIARALDRVQGLLIRQKA